MGHVFRSAADGDSWKQTSDMPGASQSYCLLSAEDGYLYCGTGYNGDVFRNSGPPTIEASLTCIPSTGTVPFVTSMTVTLTNVYTDQIRRFGGHIDVTLAGGGYFPNWRSGFTNVSPGESYVSGWNQNIPTLGP